MPDVHPLFAYSTVATAPSPATSGTSLVVAAGDGVKFTGFPFNATVWPVGAQPSTANAEIIRITGRSTDTLSPIIRAQEGSSARAIVVGDQIAVTATTKTFTDLEMQAMMGLPRAAIAQTGPRNATMSHLTGFVSQRVHLAAIALPIGVTISTITFFSGTTALGSGVNQYFGLYDDDLGSSSGTPYALLRGTTNDTSTAWAADTAKTLTLTSSYTTTRAGYFYLAILIDAGTVPTFRGPAVTNPAWLTAPIMAGPSTTLRTTLPDPAIAPAPTTSTSALIPYGFVS